jgi:hypothetical protein
MVISDTDRKSSDEPADQQAHRQGRFARVFDPPTFFACATELLGGNQEKSSQCCPTRCRVKMRSNRAVESDAREMQPRALHRGR